MHGNIVADASGRAVHPGKDRAKDCRIKKLIKISMEKSEKQTGKHNCSFLSVRYQAIHQILSEYQFFHDWGNDHRGKNDHAHIHLSNNIRYRIAVVRPLKLAGRFHQKAANHIPKIGESIA